MQKNDPLKIHDRKLTQLESKMLIFCGVISLFMSVGHAETPEPDRWWDVIEGQSDSDFSGGHSDNEDPEVAKFLKLESFEEWESYEDQFVKFRYPKHAALQLEVKEGEGGIQVEGGVCTTVDNSFSRAYILKSGEATYQVFLLNPAEWLDDGI